MTTISNAPGKIWMALKQAVTAWDECKVMLPSENYKPEATEEYVICQYVTNEYGGVLPVNGQCGIPMVGILNLSVMTPTDWGFDAQIGLAGRLADFFIDGDTYQYDDMSVKVSGRGRVLGGVSLQAPWNRMEVQIPWVAWG